MYELMIINRGETYKPIIEGNVIWDTKRMGEPGKLSFNVIT